MSTKRRIGAEDSQSRAALLDAAQRLMLREGYAAVTSRKVAAEAGLKPQLVHYYFRTMDDLFLALVRRGADQNLQRLERALESPDPLRALWDLDREPSGAALTMEFAALANHRPAVRTELVAYAEQFRQREIAAVAALVDRADGHGDWSAEALVVLFSCVGRMLVTESDMGITTGHPEALAAIERILADHRGRGRGGARAGAVGALDRRDSAPGE